MPETIVTFAQRQAETLQRQNGSIEIRARQERANLMERDMPVIEVYLEEDDLTFEGYGFSDYNILTSDAGHWITTGEGNDTINAGSGADEIYGAGGNDSITSEDGNDTVYGGSGNDRIDAGDWGLFDDTGNAKVYGGLGDDWITFVGENATLAGDEGNDFINVTDSANYVKVYGGIGNDTVSCAADGLIYAGNDDDEIQLERGGGNVSDILVSAYGEQGNDKFKINPLGPMGDSVFKLYGGIPSRQTPATTDEGLAAASPHIATNTPPSTA